MDTPLPIYTHLLKRQRNVKMNQGNRVEYENKFHTSEGIVTDKCIIILRALPRHIDAPQNNPPLARGLITRERMIYCIIVVIYARNIPGKVLKFKTQTLTRANTCPGPTTPQRFLLLPTAPTNLAFRIEMSNCVRINNYTVLKTFSG